MNQGLTFSYNMKLPIAEMEGLELPFSQQELAAMHASATQTLVKLLIILGIVSLVYAIVMIASTWRIFKKAGTSGWKALIPFYSEYTLYKIAWKKKYFFAMLLFTILFYTLLEISTELLNFGIVSLLAAVVIGNAMQVTAIISRVKLAKAFGKSDGFAIALIILPIIFMPILAFGKAKYKRGKRTRERKALPAPKTV